MRPIRSQITLAIVAFLLGVLVVVQLRAQSAPSSLDGKSTQELTALIAELNRGNEDLRTQLEDEKAALAQLQSDIAKGANTAKDLQSDLSALRGWAGLDAIQGPGVRVLLNGDLPGDAVQEVVNEIWSLGADGIAVEGVRIVPGVVVTGPPHNLTIGGTAIRDPIEIFAVGDPGALAGGLTRPGGIVSVLKATYTHIDATVDREDNGLTLPPTDRTLAPRDAQQHT